MTVTTVVRYQKKLKSCFQLALHIAGHDPCPQPFFLPFSLFKELGHWALSASVTHDVGTSCILLSLVVS